MTGAEAQAAKIQKKRENNRKSWKKNAPAINAKRRAAYADNPQKIQATNRVSYQKHRTQRQASNHVWTQSHPEKVKAIKTRYREKHREILRVKGRVYSKKYHAENQEKERLASKANYARNRERILENLRLARAENPEMYNAKQRQKRAENPEYDIAWRKAHPEASRVKQARRSARIRGASLNDLTATQWEFIKAHYGHRCVYCERKMKRLTMDHITPIAKGGNHTASNIVPACQSCNSKKHAGPVLQPVQPLLLTTNDHPKKDTP